jgi:lysozyme
MLIDVSRYNRIIDFKKAKTFGVTEVISRTGVGFNGDPFFGRNFRRAKLEGMKAGAYYVPNWTYDQAMQVEALGASLDGAGWAQDGEVWIDCEVSNGFAGTRLRQAIQGFMMAAEKALGVRPGIYTARWWWDPNVGLTSWAKTYSLWVANYTAAPKPLMPKGWTDWRIWQYSETGIVPGIPGSTDLNRRP